MNIRELIVRALDLLSEEDLNRLLAFLRAMSEEHAEEPVPLMASKPVLTKDWLSSDEDAAWASLQAASPS